MPTRTVIAALLAATALGGCAQLQADLQAVFKPRIEILSEIEQDLYRAILASDKIEKLRRTSQADKPSTTRKKATAGPSVSADPGARTVAEAQPEQPAKPASVEKDAMTDIAPKVTLTVTEAEPQKGSIYLSKSEINPVQLTFQGDAQSFFERVADDIDYTVVEEGSNRMVDLNIKANGEPLFGVAIRAANYVEKDMRVRFDMEEKVIRIEYLDQ